MNYKHLFVSVLLSLLFTAFPASVFSATFVINSNTDSNDHAPGDGICDWDSVTSGEQCSIRAAIDEANADALADIILIPPRKNHLPWAHTGSEPWCIGNSVTLSGTRSEVKIAGMTTSSGSIFKIYDKCSASGQTTNIVIENVHIYGADSDSRAIHLQRNGSLLLRRCSVSGFQGDGDSIKESIKVSDSAEGITIDSCQIVDNLVTGILASSGNVEIINSEISRNGKLTEATSGIYLSGGIPIGTVTQMDIVDSLVSHNKSHSLGAGIYVRSGAVLHLVNSTVSNNQGGLSGAGVFVGASAFASINAGKFYSSNSTIADNKGWLDDDTPKVRGAGLGSGLDIGTSFNGNGDAAATIVNTLIAGNTAGSKSNRVLDDCSGRVDSNGYNFIQSNHCTITVLTNSGTNLLNQDPLLEALSNNGGSYPTHRVAATSLVIDGGDISECKADHDQRELSRPRGKSCDIGAVEHFFCSENPNQLRLSNATVSKRQLEQSCGSIDIEGTYSISETGYLNLRSKINRFHKGFSVAKGGVLKVFSQSPEI